MTIKKIYVCSKCRSRDVQSTAWVTLNTGVPNNSEGPLDSVWCDECQDDNADLDELVGDLSEGEALSLVEHARSTLSAVLDRAPNSQVAARARRALASLQLVSAAAEHVR